MMLSWRFIERESKPALAAPLLAFCHGSGRAPGDGRTACGFCEERLDKSAGID
jgi:hypothetical protein